MQIAPTHKAIGTYYAELEQYASLGATYEQATRAARAAFQKLLSAFAHPAAGWTLILEQPLANGRKPGRTRTRTAIGLG